MQSSVGRGEEKDSQRPKTAYDPGQVKHRMKEKRKRKRRIN
jgi:hypothetical protein